MPNKTNAFTYALTLFAATVLLISSGFAAETISLVDNLDDHSAQLSIKSSTVDAVKFDVDIDAVGLRPDEVWDGSYQHVGLPEGENMVAGSVGEIGEPELPTLTTFIAIPDQAGITVTARYESYEIIDNVDIMPVQIPMPERGFDGPVAFARDESAYSQDRFYPEVLAEAGEPVIMRDVRMVQIAVYPVHYNPVTRQMKVYRDISIDVSYDGEVINPMMNRPNYVSEAFLPLYRLLVANFDEYLNTTLASLEIKRGGLLIISPDVSGYMWKEPMEEIANWKRAKGYDVVHVGTYEVDATDGRPSQTQVKSYIQNAYNNWEVAPEFIYLVGDEDRIIPDYPYSSYVSDHPYSMLEGSDYLPEAAVCRVSVDNITELNTWIAKTLLYDRDPDITSDPEYYKRAIMVAGAQQTVTCAWTVLWAKERLHQHGFTQIDTVFDRGSDPPDYRMTNPITAGVGFVNYRGWAGPSGWYDPSYNVGALNQCQNVNKPGVMTSIVCGTGDFGDSYSDPCFGEQWIRMGSATAPRGGPSFFGSTDHGTNTRWNNPISLGFYHSFLEADVYHFGLAVIAGKLRQYSNFPREYSTIQKYFHTYNMLGDPELEMRLTTPIALNVVHDTNIDRGQNILEVFVRDGFDQSIENAYVTLIMGEGENESFYSVTKTDANGMAYLEVPTDTTGELALTVSGRDLKPYLATINLTQADVVLGQNSIVIDDDMYGASNGNGDGEINPGETIELQVNLENFGSSATAENAYAELTAFDGSEVVIHGNYASYGNIEPGQIASGNNKFILTVMQNVVDGDELIFFVDASADGYEDYWHSTVNLPVVAARFDIDDIQISGDNRLDPGETVDMTIGLTNVGGLNAEGLTGTLYTTDGYVRVAPATAVFGDIAIEGSGDNSATPFSVTVDEATFEGKSVPFILNLKAADGAEFKVNFSLVVGTISASDPGGPDAYGYYVYDNTDTSYPEFPTYDWMSIRYLGTNTNLYDDSKTMVNLPFQFVYYGDTYERITICSNGWICMDSTQWVGFRNWRMPDPSYAQTMIAGFWDDLGPSGADNVYTYYDADNYRYIIEWYNVRPRWSTSYRETFQIILYNPAFHRTITGDGVIEFMYNDINNFNSGSGENYATVGWEDSTELIGFSISYSNAMAPGCANLMDNRAYRITTNTGRGGISGATETFGQSVAGTFVETSTGQWTISGDDGTYLLKDVPPGMVNITYSKDGYFPETLTDVNVTANYNIADQDADLTACPFPGSLEASEALGDHVNLTWVEVNHPDLAGYDIYRGNFEDGIFNKLNDSPVTGGSYDDYTTEGSDIYWYYVTAVYVGDDYDAVSRASNKDMGSNDEITGIEDDIAIPDKFSLSQNFPNPFNAQTTISFAIPQAGHVALEIFNILGQKVNTLFDGQSEAGYMTLIWNGTDQTGSEVASGLYFYRLSTDTERITRRMLMLK